MRLHTRMLIHRDAFIHGCFYTEMLFTKTCFFTDACTYRCFFAEMPLGAAAFTLGCFYTGILLHRAAFAHRHAGASTHRCLYTAMFLHICALHRKSCDTEYPFHRENYFAQIVLRGDVRCFYARIHLYTGVFYTQILHRYFYKEVFCTDAFTQRCFYTQALLD